MKSQILKNFTRAIDSYETVADVQKQCAQQLLSQLTQEFPNINPNSILDIGTGTGFIPQLLLKLYPNSKYSINDISAKLINKTKLIFNNNNYIKIFLGDMDELDFCHHQLTISNFALQWSNNLNKTITKLYNNSDILAFTCLLDGTFSEWGNLFERLNLSTPIFDYPTETELKTHLIKLNPKQYFFKSIDYKKSFESPYHFMKYLKELGANCSNSKIQISDIKKIIKTNTAPLEVTYKVSYVIIRR